MSFIGLQVPHPTSRILGEIPVPGTKTDPGESHITMIYLGKGVGIDVLTAAIKATFQVTARTNPFSVRTNRVSTFSPNPDDGVPVIARVESDPLHELRTNLVKSFKRAGVQFNNKYPDYKPHVTLAYIKEPDPDPLEEFRIPTVEWGAHELVMWGGDRDEHSLVVTFPFRLQGVDRIAKSVTARYLEQIR